MQRVAARAMGDLVTATGAVGDDDGIGRLADRYNPAIIIGSGFALGTVAIVLAGHAGQSSTLLCTIAFVSGALSLGAQICTVALCSSFYETFLRATGVGWGMGIGRGGAIVGPVLGGLLLAAGAGASTLFLVAGLTSLVSAMGVYSLGLFVPRFRTLHRGGDAGEQGVAVSSARP